jgi:hypothetical protein
VRPAGPFRSRPAGRILPRETLPSSLTRVLLIQAGLPTMLGDIVIQSLTPHADVEIVRAADARGLAGAVRETGAEVVVGTEGELPLHEVRSVLDDQPRARVFTLAPDARMAWLYELRPERVPLGELSPSRLAEAIRSRSVGAGALGRSISS